MTYSRTFVFAVLLSCLNLLLHSQDRYWSRDFADAIIDRHETSGSAMFVCSLKKAIDNNYVDSVTYWPVLEKGWEGVQSKITLDEHDRPVINDFVRGMGIKDDYEAYISQEIVSTPDSPIRMGIAAFYRRQRPWNFLCRLSIYIP